MCGSPFFPSSDATCASILPWQPVMHVLAFPLPSNQLCVPLCSPYSLVIDLQALLEIPDIDILFLRSPCVALVIILFAKLSHVGSLALRLGLWIEAVRLSLVFPVRSVCRPNVPRSLFDLAWLCVHPILIQAFCFPIRKSNAHLVILFVSLRHFKLYPVFLSSSW